MKTIKLQKYTPVARFPHPVYGLNRFDDVLMIRDNKNLFFYQLNQDRSIDLTQIYQQNFKTSITQAQFIDEYYVVICEDGSVYFYELFTWDKLYTSQVNLNIRNYDQVRQIRKIDDIIYFIAYTWIGKISPFNDVFVLLKTEREYMRGILSSDPHLVSIGDETVTTFHNNMFDKDQITQTEESIHCLDVSDEIVAYGSPSGVYTVIDRYSNDVIDSRKFHAKINEVKIIDNQVFLALSTGKLMILDLIKDQIHKFDFSSFSVLSLATKKEKVLLGTANGNLIIVDMSTKKQITTINAHKSEILCITTDKFHIYTTSASGKIKVWNHNNYKNIAKMKQKDAVLSIYVSDDEIITGGANNTLIRWNKSQFEKISVKEDAHDDWITHIHGDKKYIYTIGYDGYLRIWNHKLHLKRVVHVKRGYLYAMQVHIDTIFISTDSGIMAINKFPMEGNRREYGHRIKGVVTNNKNYGIRSSNNEIVQITHNNGNIELESITNRTTNMSLHKIYANDKYLVYNYRKEIYILDLQKKEEVLKIITNHRNNVILDQQFLYVHQEGDTEIYLIEDLLS